MAKKEIWEPDAPDGAKKKSGEGIETKRQIVSLIVVFRPLLKSDKCLNKKYH